MFTPVDSRVRDPLMRYAGLLSRLSVTPLVVIWLKGHQPIVHAGLQSVRRRVDSAGQALDALGVAVTSKRSMLRIDDARKETDRDVADHLIGLGVALLASPIMHDGKRAGCIMVIDDVSRGWLAMEEHALIEIAAEVTLELDRR